MAKKMGMRGRPGIFFVIILLIFLVVFFMTWRSMTTPKKITEVKDVYSMNFQNVNQHKKEKKNPSRPQSDPNDLWSRAKLLERQNVENGKDEDYPLHDVLKKNLPLRGKNEDVKSPLSALLHVTQKAVNHEEMPPFYRKLNETLKIVGGRMDRLVHLDLKGAAPKLSYFKEVFPLFSRLGATGLLIEYEDMFPYSRRLKNISAENAYTPDQIKELLALAKLNSLQVIPLVQTFGHMEFVLKSSTMKDLRESEYTPQVIDITSDSSYEIIKELIGQVLEAHPSIKYLHVGCDEVYELGRGKSSDVVVREKISLENLFLRHVGKVATIISGLSRGVVRPIIWDDELRKMPEQDIVSSGLPAVTDIMIWRYTQNVSDVLDDALWKKYGRLFKTVWVASSFKGATGSRQLYTEPQHHIINHFSWLDAMAKYGRYVSIKGIALTGWQRYDHFATLCELLPVAIPSLAVCLATIRNGGFDKEVHKTTSTILGCSSPIEMSFPELDKKERSALVTQDCRFPGHMVYYAVQQLWGYKQFGERDRTSGWLSDYQVHRGFSNPGQLKVLSMRLFALDSHLIQSKTPLETQLLKIYSEDTVQEWLDENIYETQRQLKEVQNRIKIMVTNTHWARRPLSKKELTSNSIPADKKVMPQLTKSLVEGQSRANELKSNNKVPLKNALDKRNSQLYTTKPVFVPGNEIDVRNHAQGTLSNSEQIKDIDSFKYKQKPLSNTNRKGYENSKAFKQNVAVNGRQDLVPVVGVFESGHNQRESAVKSLKPQPNFKQSDAFDTHKYENQRDIPSVIKADLLHRVPETDSNINQAKDETMKSLSKIKNLRPSGGKIVSKKVADSDIQFADGIDGLKARNNPLLEKNDNIRKGFDDMVDRKLSFKRRINNGQM